MRDENFALHIRRRRFISKIICEGLVGGGCSGQYKWIHHILMSKNKIHSNCNWADFLFLAKRLPSCC